MKKKRPSMSLKKTSLVMCTLLFLIIILKIDVKPTRAEPRTWTVDDDAPADFLTIQKAIQTANNGDLIYVFSGTYYENLIIDKPVTLTGERKQSTILDGNRSGTVIKVTANNVVITGFTIRGSGNQPGTLNAGVEIAGYVNLTDSIITRNQIGVHVSSKGNITKNIVTNNGKGISIYYSSEVTVEENNFTSNTYGVSLHSSFNNSIVKNTITESSLGGHGITVLSGSYNNTILRNRILNNSHGIWLSGSYNNRIVENTIANNKILGIELTDSPDNTIYHNNFIKNKKHIVVNKPNTWNLDYSEGGNYWHDYTNIDEKGGPSQEEPGSDGIWDNPYVINENNIDGYPSVQPFGEIALANAGPDQTVKEGTPVYFDASGSKGTIISFEWLFGDGTQEQGVAVTHTYDKNGVYTVTLIVKDLKGVSDTDLMTVTVVQADSFPLPPPPALINISAVVIGITIVAALLWKRK